MKWILYFPLNTIFTIICYLTNWAVTPFADGRGELHGFLRYWQTWDDTLDVDWFVKTRVPRIFRYDFDKHYKAGREHTKELDRYNRTKGCVIILNDNFTMKERIQRYICRTLWLYRNNSYGFAFFLFGTESEWDKLVDKEVHYENGDWYEVTYGKEGSLWNRPWKLTGQFGWISFLFGWKLYGYTGLTRSMIAGRIILRKKKKEE